MHKLTRLFNGHSTVIGLFGLIGFVGVCCTPLYGRAIDRIEPWHVSIGMSFGLLLMFCLYWGAVGINIAAPVLVTLGMDIFRQSQQISLATRIFSLGDGLRSRLNACSIFAVRLNCISCIGICETDDAGRWRNRLVSDSSSGARRARRCSCSTAGERMARS